MFTGPGFQKTISPDWIRSSARRFMWHSEFVLILQFDPRRDWLTMTFCSSQHPDIHPLESEDEITPEARYWCILMSQHLHDCHFMRPIFRYAPPCGHYSKLGILLAGHWSICRRVYGIALCVSFSLCLQQRAARSTQQCQTVVSLFGGEIEKQAKGF